MLGRIIICRSIHVEISNHITANDDLFIILNSDTLSAMETHFPTKLSPARPVYEILLPTCLKKIALDGELSPDNNIDTDKDTLTDWEEVNVDELIKLSDGNYTLPHVSVNELVNILNRFDSEEYLFITERTLPVYYLPILSDPTSVDLDEDGFPDIYCEETKNISEYAFDDPRPLYSDVTVHHISQREYLPIKRHGEGNANYGSSQTWFREDLSYSLFSGGNVDANYASSKGCGLIAIGDILAYLELYNDKFNLMPYMNKIIQRFSSSQTTVAGYIPSIEEFRSNLGCTYDSDECRYVINSDYYLEYLRSLSYDAIIHKGKNISGVLPSNMVDIFNDAFSTNSVPYTATWCFDNSYKKIERRIDTMLDNNIPVIISYDYTVIPINDSNNYKVDPLKLYVKDEGVIDYDGTSIKSHYMVVCEDIQFSDYVIAETEIKNSRLLKVSSWGSEYYIDFNEYCEQVNRLKGPSYTGPFIHGAGRLLRDYTCNILNIEESS